MNTTMNADHQVRQISGGANQSGVRVYNERLLLSLLQRSGPSSGSDLARKTGLSPQTVSVILRKLEKDGILQKGASVKGKVGKPSVPMALNPDGILAFGLKIGRRSADLVLLDVTGKIRAKKSLNYPYPMPDDVFEFLKSGLRALTRNMTEAEQSRICGIGVAVPFEMWNWGKQIGAPEQDFKAWKDVNFAVEAAKFTNLPVFAINDATAACRAEHVLGIGKAFRDYAYFYIGAFIGGGVVLNHSVVEGNRGNAGALGSLPTVDADGKACQLLDRASIRQLETAIAASGLDPNGLWQNPQDWSPFTEQIAVWADQCATELARASLAACSVIDFEAILIDGAIPVEVKTLLLTLTREKIKGLDMRGIIPPAIEAGVVGIDARAIGAATGPILCQFLLDTNAALLIG